MIRFYIWVHLLFSFYFISCSAERTKVSVKEMSDDEFQLIVKKVKKEQEEQKTLSLAENNKENKLESDTPQQEINQKSSQTQVPKEEKYTELNEKTLDQSKVEESSIFSVDNTTESVKESVENESASDKEAGDSSKNMGENPNSQVDPESNNEEEHNSKNEIESEKKTLEESDKGNSIDENITIDESLAVLNEKLKLKEKKFVRIFNPLGYSISVPYTFSKVLENSQLWKFKGFHENKELQFVVGYLDNKPIPLLVFLEKIIESYKEKLKIKWSSVKSLNEEELKLSMADEGLYSETQFENNNYTNYIQIRTFKRGSSLAFIVATYTVHNKDGDIHIMNETFSEILNSFQFVQN